MDGSRMMAAVQRDGGTRRKPGAFAGVAFAVALAAVLMVAPTVAHAEADTMNTGDRRAFADGLYSRGMHALAAREYDALLKDLPDVAERDVVLYRLGECLR